MPNAPVAWSTSPQVHPPSTRTVWAAGFTVVLRQPPRSITNASFQTPKPPPWCAPPRMASVMPCSRAKLTQAITSATSAHRTTAAGRRSTAPL